MPLKGSIRVGKATVITKTRPHDAGELTKGVPLLGGNKSRTDAKRYIKVVAMC